MKKRERLKFLLVMAVMMLLGITFNVTNAKADTVTYDYKDTIFGQRTKEEVVKEYSKAQNAGSDTYNESNSSTYYFTPASTENPYHQGVLTDDTIKSMEGMTNFFRYLAGVEKLQNPCKQNESLQYQALDRNFEFAHFISSKSKPSDMSDELWNKGAKCNHNILALGYTPSGAIAGWMNEGYDLRTKRWDTLGHRYALISPQFSDIQFGYSGTIAIGKDCESNNPDYTQPFSAFPQAGYMPQDLVYASRCAWSVDLNSTKVTASNASKIEVTVKNLSTGESYKCSEAEESADISKSRIAFVQPSDATDGRYKDTYNVKITGLTDVSTGNEAVINYDVKFFDATQSSDSYVESVHPEGFSKLIVYETMGDTENLKKAAAVLPDEVQVTAASGYKTTVKVKDNWKLDEKNQCYTNSADKTDLPSHVKDKFGKLDKITLPYEVTDGEYKKYNTLSTRGMIREGEEIRFYVYRTYTSSKHSKIYKLQKNSDETYSGIEKFDRYTSKEYDEEASAASTYSASDIYNYGPLKISDSGDYLSIYYSDGGYSGEAYLSTSILTLNVNHHYETSTVKPTCTTDGYTLYKCKTCGDEYKDEIKDKLGHAYETTVVKSTCTTGGYTLHKCSICGDSYKDTQTIHLGHNAKLHNAKKATYFATGYTGDSVCTRCKEVLKKGKTIKKLTLAKPSIKGSAGKKQIKITLKKVSGASKYEIKAKLGKKTKTYYTTKTTYTIKNLNSKATYTITVRAMAVKGKQTAYSAYASAKIKVK